MYPPLCNCGSKRCPVCGDPVGGFYPMCPTAGCVLRAGHPGACDIR